MAAALGRSVALVGAFVACILLWMFIAQQGNPQYQAFRRGKLPSDAAEDRWRDPAP